jgi:hypothetical protein
VKSPKSPFPLLFLSLSSLSLFSFFPEQSNAPGGEDNHTKREREREKERERVRKASGGGKKGKGLSQASQRSYGRQTDRQIDVLGS